MNVFYFIAHQYDDLETSTMAAWICKCYNGKTQAFHLVHLFGCLRITRGCIGCCYLSFPGCISMWLNSFHVEMWATCSLRATTSEIAYDHFDPSHRPSWTPVSFFLSPFCGHCPSPPPSLKMIISSVIYPDHHIPWDHLFPGLNCECKLPYLALETVITNVGN